MSFARSFKDDAAENSIMQTITIAVSAILVAAGLVTAPGLINNARDNNATTDLANVAYAQEYRLADSGQYASDITAFQSSAVKLTLAGDTSPRIISNADNTVYAVFDKSKSGKVFWRSSDSSKFYVAPTPWSSTAPAEYPASLEWPASADDATAQHATNMLVDSGVSNIDNFQGFGSVVQNTSWGVGDKSSAKIVPDSSSPDSFLYYKNGGQSNGVTLGMKPGHTYTVSGTIHLDKVQPADAWKRARTITTFWVSPGSSYIETNSTPAPNTVGDHRVSMTFTLPADANEAFIRWYDGTTDTNNGVSWDNLMLSEGGPALYTPNESN
jgi:hypothetical protein